MCHGKGLDFLVRSRAASMSLMACGNFLVHDRCTRSCDRGLVHSRRREEQRDWLVWVSAWRRPELRCGSLCGFVVCVVCSYAWLILERITNCLSHSFMLSLHSVVATSPSSTSLISHPPDGAIEALENDISEAKHPKWRHSHHLRKAQGKSTRLECISAILLLLSGLRLESELDAWFWISNKSILRHVHGNSARRWVIWRMNICTNPWIVITLRTSQS